MKTTLFLSLLVLLCVGCASKPPLSPSNFLDDYSRLDKADDNRMRYVSSKLKDYTAFMVDPVEMEIAPQKLSDKDRAEVARYFRTKVTQVLESRQHRIVSEADVNVARVRIAMTGIANSTWWQKLHPGMRMTGTGTGGASCEGEVIDSVTGEQLAAWIVTNSGNQFDFTAFSTVADVKAVIDRWAVQAGNRLDDLRGAKQPGEP
jgi:hypothetical protein